MNSRLRRTSRDPRLRMEGFQPSGDFLFIKASAPACSRLFAGSDSWRTGGRRLLGPPSCTGSGSRLILASIWRCRHRPRNGRPPQQTAPGAHHCCAPGTRLVGSRFGDVSSDGRLGSPQLRIGRLALGGEEGHGRTGPARSSGAGAATLMPSQRGIITSLSPDRAAVAGCRPAWFAIAGRW